MCCPVCPLYSDDAFFLMAYKWFPMCKVSSRWERSVSVISWWIVCYENGWFPMYQISARWELSVCPIGSSCFVSIGQCQSNAGEGAWLINVTDGYEKRG